MKSDCEPSRVSNKLLQSGLWISLILLTLAGCVSVSSPSGAEPNPSAMPTTLASPTAPPPVQPSVTPSSEPTPTHWLPQAELPLGTTQYKLPLTILHVTETTATLFFELDQPAPGTLVLQPESTTGFILEVPVDPARSRHVIEVEGLEPGTSYRLTLAIESAEAGLVQPGFLSQGWGPVRLHTVSSGAPLRFGMLSDASFSDPVTEQLVQEMAAYDLDFVLHAGDVVDELQTGADPFVSYAEKFFKPFETLLVQMPVYTVPGNHDYDPDIRYQGQPFYFYAFPPFSVPGLEGNGDPGKRQFYAFSYQGLQFILLDTQTFFGMPGRQEQLDWLTERLADPDFRASIPVFHVSPYSSSVVHPTDSLPVRSSWVPLFEAAQVPLVLSGHFHHYERLSNGEVTYIVAGGGSSILYAQGQRLPGSELYLRRSHFLILEADEEGLSLQSIALGGEILDEVQLLLP